MSASPQIVLVGKSNQDYPEMTEILKNIKASQVPHEILDTIYITVVENNEHNRYQISTSSLADSKVSYKNIGEHVNSLGIKEQVVAIEVVVDLDKVYNFVNKESSKFFDAVMS